MAIFASAWAAFVLPASVPSTARGRSDYGEDGQWLKGRRRSASLTFAPPAATIGPRYFSFSHRPRKTLRKQMIISKSFVRHRSRTLLVVPDSFHSYACTIESARVSILRRLVFVDVLQKILEHPRSAFSISLQSNNNHLLFHVLRVRVVWRSWLILSFPSLVCAHRTCWLDWRRSW